MSLTVAEIRAGLVRAKNLTNPVVWPTELLDMPVLWVKRWPLSFYQQVNDVLSTGAGLKTVQLDALVLGLCTEDGLALYTAPGDLEAELPGPAADFVFGFMLDYNGFGIKKTTDRTEEAKNLQTTGTAGS